MGVLISKLEPAEFGARVLLLCVLVSRGSSDLREKVSRNSHFPFSFRSPNSRGGVVSTAA